MRANCFFDTNVLIYAVSAHEPHGELARQALAGGGVVSVQVFNEFVAVSRRKLRSPWSVILEDLRGLRTIFPDPLPLTIANHRHALRLAEAHGVAFYDALILASALEAGCTTLFTEDLQAGRVFEGQLTIVNPFAAPSPPADPASGR